VPGPEAQTRVDRPAHDLVVVQHARAGVVQVHLHLLPRFACDLPGPQCARRLAVHDAGLVEVADVHREAVANAPVAVVALERPPLPELRLADRYERPRRVDVQHMAVHDRHRLAQEELDPVHPARLESPQPLE